MEERPSTGGREKNDHWPGPPSGRQEVGCASAIAFKDRRTPQSAGVLSYFIPSLEPNLTIALLSSLLTQTTTNSTRFQVSKSLGHGRGGKKVRG